MAHITADRVLDTSTTTGTGAFTVSGTAPSSYRTFSAVCATSDTLWYTIQHQTASEWEVGLGTYSSANTITRTTVLASSNAGSAVNFSAGTKNVFLTMPAAIFSGAVIGVPYGGTGAATLTGVLKGNGTSALSAATAGTDFVAPGTATTFTATQTFNGTSSAVAMVLADAAETVTVSATAATGTINYDVTTQSVLYYTSNAGANWTVNFRGSSGTSLNTLMATGQSITVAFLVTQGATPYYNSAVQIDGNAVTPKYQGGTAWTAGNASAIDAYIYTIIKTASATFTVLASQTQFK